MNKYTFTEQFILRNIGKISDKNKECVYEELMLIDTKELIGEIIGTTNSSFKRYALFFLNAECEQEDRKFIKTIFDRLRWENVNRDVINSLWTTYKSGLVIAKVCKSYRFSKSFANIINGKEKYLNKYLGLGAYDTSELINDANIVVQKYDFNKLAAKCHCIANFMPCPSIHEKGKKTYNQLKGILPDVQDYFPLMIDKIQECVDKDIDLQYVENKTLIKISIDTIIEWQKWFIANQKKYFLEDYYRIEDMNNEKRIVGNPLFSKQKLSYPIPKSLDELKECLEEIDNRINARAKQMAKIL